jgi:hypothetical protein
MATKKVLSLDGGKFSTVGTDDLADIAGDLKVGGDLNVIGDIVSGGSTNVVVADQFLDLGVGATAAQNTGFTFSVDRGTATQSITSITGSTRVVVVGDNSSFLVGDIVVISGSDLASNDGLYAISVVDGGGTDITLDNTNQSKAPFLQTSIGDGGASGSISQVDLTVLAVSDGTLVNTAGGTISAGDLSKAYYTDATVSDFVTTGYDEVTPAAASTPGLTAVYGAGDTLTTSSSNDVEFQLASGDFIIQQGQINIGDTAGTTIGDVTSVFIDGGGFSAGANRELTGFLVAVDATALASNGGLALQSATQDSGAVDISITDMANGGTFTITDGTDIMAEFGGASADAITLFANKPNNGGFITRATSNAGEDLTISLTGATNSSIVIASAGTDVDAIQLNASAATSGVTIFGGSSGLDLDFTLAGQGGGDGDLNAKFAANSVLDVAGANLTLSTTTSGTLAVTSAGALDIDGQATTLDATTLSIDSTDDSNLTMTADDGGAKTLTIAGLNDGLGNGNLALNAKSTVLIQNGGTDKVSIGSTTVILSAALQASESGGLQFGGSGQNVVSIVNSTTGISLTAAADTKLVTEAEIAAYADSAGSTDWARATSYTDDTTGDAIRPGDVVAINGSGNAIFADSAGVVSGSEQPIGVCIFNDTGAILVTNYGRVENVSGLTAGAPVYVDNSDATGNYTSTAPASGTVYQVGIADSTTSFIIQLQFIVEIA